MSDTQTKRHHVTREDEADRDLNGTEFSKGAAALVTLFFLAFVFGVPVVQHFVEIKGNMAKRAEWKQESGAPMPGIAPKVYDVFGLLPTGKDIGAAKGFWGYWGLIPSTERINAFEEDLKQQSVLTQALLSPAQDVLTGILGVGNEKAYCGKPGWLFYRPDVEYLTSDGFMDPHILKMRSHQSSDVQPNPVKAILDFDRQLKERGIKLVVVPMPTKPMIHPEMLSGEGADAVPLQNPSFNEFASQLDKAGVLMYDPTKLLLDRKASTGQKQYLETDTHWTPDAMGAVSQDLSAFIQKNAPLNPLQTAYEAKPLSISNLGDIAEMLKLPKDQTIYKAQSVTDQQILHDGQPWTMDKKGDVLLLGDSFSNIFSKAEMNWGEASGFAEHLSKDLGRPLDKIVINAGGSYASRSDLARDMYRTDRLAGKKVVIYEFSMRDLSQGDWKMIELPKPKVEPTPTPPDNHVVTPPKATPVFSMVTATPSTIDPAKNEVADLKFVAPKGATWKASVQDQKGKLVLDLPGGQGTGASADVKWDGKGKDKKPVATGAYTIVLSGSVNTDKLADVPTTVLVTNSAVIEPLKAIGATPSTIDPATQVAVATFTGPKTGKFKAMVLDSHDKVVRVLTKPSGTSGLLSVKWDGKDDSGKAVADGQYRVRVTDSENPLQLATAETVVKAKAAAKPAPNTGIKPPKTGPEKTNIGTKPPVEEELTVTGRIASRGPQPKAGAYKDAVLALHLVDLKVTGGKIGNGDILVYVWGMRDNNLTDGAYQVGSTVTFHLIPWDKAEGKYGSFNRIELENDDYYTWPTFWGENKK